MERDGEGGGGIESPSLKRKEEQNKNLLKKSNQKWWLARYLRYFLSFAQKIQVL